MGIIDKFLTRLGLKEAEVPLVSSFQIQSQSRSGFFSSKKSTDFYKGWVFLCVDSIKNEVAKIQLKLFRYDKNGNKEYIFDHPAINLLHKVNPFFTKYTLFERLQANLELQGNEYWSVVRDRKGVPVEIYPLQPSLVTPIADQFKYIGGYRYSIDSKTWNIPAESMIHFKNFNPASDIFGLSTLEAVKVSVETDEAAKAYNKQFFENSATPGIVLEYPGVLNRDTMQKMKEQWDAEYRGFKKAYRTAVAAGGLKIHQMEYKQTDMQYMEQRKFSRDEILALFRVPGTVAGILETTVYAGAKAAEYVFARRTIEPKMTRIVDTLNEFYLPLFGEEGLEFEFVSPVPKDMVEQTAYYQSGINNGYLSINDVRRMEGLPEVEDGEDVFLPFSLTPYSRPAAKKINEKPVSKTLDQKLEEIAQKMASEIAKKTETQIHPKLSNETFEKMGEGKIKAVRSRTAKYEKALVKASKQLFEDQKERAIKKLKDIKAKSDFARKNQVRTKKAVSLLDEEFEIKATIDLFEPIFADLTKAEGRAAIEFLGFDPSEFDVDSPEMREFLRKNTKKFAGEVTKKTSEDLRELIVEGLDEGEAIEGLTTRIAEYSGFKTYRAETIARTETIRAQGKAELEAWKQSEVVDSAIWYTALDERVDDDCLVLHGKEVPLGKAFMSEDELVEFGYDIYEGAVDAPPLHPNCRCTLIPVVK